MAPRKGDAPGGPILVEIAIVLGLILLNGVFAGAEIAILSVRRTRLEELVEAGSRGANALTNLRADPERLLATLQVGITVIGSAAAAFSGSSIADRLAPTFAQIPYLADVADDLALGVVVAGVSYLSLVLGELVPKSLALRSAEVYALFVAPTLAGLSWMVRPLVWLLTGSSNVVLRIFGDQTSFSESRLSPEELQQLVAEAASAGTLEANVGEIASRAFDLDELDLSAVMVPRRDIVAIRSDASFDQLARTAMELGHARLLVHNGDLDDVLGFVNVREALARARMSPGLAVADLVRPVSFFPETMAVPTALRSLQAQRAHLAVVLDEQGSVRGLVTIEDLVEELVGEIWSEDEQAESTIHQNPDGTTLVQGATPIHEVNRALGIELPETETFSTIAGLILETVGRIPEQGEVVRVPGFALEVTDASRRRVKAVRITKDPTPSPP